MSEEKRLSSFGTKAVKILLPLILISIGGAAWSFFRATAPVMKRATPQRQVSVVDVLTVSQVNAPIVISAMGTVTPSREVTIKAQVSGTVQSVSARFIPGGLVAEGDELLSLDPSDYEIEVKKAQSALVNARAALAIEQGSQNIAKEELRLLSELAAETGAKTDLALRKPHLQQARADVTSAQADLTQAKLNFSRTVARAPFNAMIVERDVNVGAYVGVQDSLATIVGTDEFWIEAVVPLDQLGLIDLDHQDGCPAVILSQAGNGQWEGRVIQVAGKLNETSRMATVIVAVKDPLGKSRSLSASRLMIDDYVHVDITARELTDVIELPRSALQDGNTVWVYQNNTLDIRKVTPVWKNKEKVFLKTGLAPGEHVVMSSLSTPVQGMPLRTGNHPSNRSADSSAAK